MRLADLPLAPAQVDRFRQMVRAGRVPHALLLRGAPGAGQLAFAFAMAQYLVCERTQPPDPSTSNLFGAPEPFTPPDDACGECGSCRKVQQLIHPDVHLVAPIASQAAGAKTDDLIEQLRPLLTEQPLLSLSDWSATLDADNKQLAIGVTDIRNLKHKLLLKAFGGGKKVVLVWHADKMNPQAANALLKLLEEPPDDTVLLLTAEEPAQLLPTIVSRCQTLVLPPIGRERIADYLTAHAGADPAQAAEAARLADGDLSEAIRLLQHTGSEMAPAYQTWMRLCYEGNFPKLLQWADELGHDSKEAQKHFLRYTLAQLRDTLLLQADTPQLVHLPPAEENFLRKFGQALQPIAVMAAVDRVETALFHVGRNANSLLALLTLSLDLHRAFRTK